MTLFNKFAIKTAAKVANPAKDVAGLADLSTLAAEMCDEDCSGLAALAAMTFSENGQASSRVPQIKQCYCCKSIDFWVGGTEKYPHNICRRCHPPAPGAEVSHAPKKQ